MDAGSIAKTFIDFYHSAFFVVIKFLLAIYSIVLILNLAMIVILRGFGRDYRVTFVGTNLPSQKSTRKKWKKIINRLESGNSAQYKIAILEADSLADRILDFIGHKGENMPDRLSQLDESHLENAEDLAKAHQIRNNIIHDKEFLVSRETAEEVLGIYEKFLDHFELI